MIKKGPNRLKVSTPIIKVTSERALCIPRQVAAFLGKYKVRNATEPMAHIRFILHVMLFDI